MKLKIKANRQSPTKITAPIVPDLRDVKFNFDKKPSPLKINKVNGNKNKKKVSELKYSDIQNKVQKHFTYYDFCLNQRFYALHCLKKNGDIELWNEYFEDKINNKGISKSGLNKGDRQNGKDVLNDICTYRKTFFKLINKILNDSCMVNEKNETLINKYFLIDEYYTEDNRYIFTEDFEQFFSDLIKKGNINVMFMKDDRHYQSSKYFNDLLFHFGFDNGGLGQSSTKPINDMMTMDHFEEIKDGYVKKLIKKDKKIKEVEEEEKEKERKNVNPNYKLYYQKFINIHKDILKVHNMSYPDFVSAKCIIEEIDNDEGNVLELILNHFKLLIYYDLQNYYYDKTRKNAKINDRKEYNFGLFNKYINTDILSEENIETFFDEFQGEIDNKLKIMLDELLERIPLPLIINNQTIPIANLKPITDEVLDEDEDHHEDEEKSPIDTKKCKEKQITEDDDFNVPDSFYIVAEKKKKQREEKRKRMLENANKRKGIMVEPESQVIENNVIISPTKPKLKLNIIKPTVVNNVIDSDKEDIDN